MTTKTFIQKICCRYVVLNLIAMAVVCTALVYAAMFCADIYTHHGEAIAVPDIRNKKFADADMEQILKTLADNAEEYGIILRAKGIVPNTDGEWIHFDLTPGEYEIRKGAADYTGKLCVIGSNLKEDKLAELFGVA